MKIPPVPNSEKLMELNFTILHSFHGWVHRPTVIKSVFEYALTNKHYVGSGLVVHSYPKETIFVVGVPGQMSPFVALWWSIGEILGSEGGGFGSDS